MITYKVKLVSQPHAIAFIILALAVIITEAVILPSHGLDVTPAILLTVAELAVGILLWQKFVTGWTEWKVDNDRITITWTKRFAFSELEDFLFEWQDIERIWKGMDTNYYNLKFRFTFGETITFYHASFGTDDFEQLIKILYQTLNDKNKLLPK
jgi:hypothetical protein